MIKVGYETDLGKAKHQYCKNQQIVYNNPNFF